MPEGWVNVYDAQDEAERRLEPGPRGYFSGGAGDEVTMRANVAAWQGWRLRPRQLTGAERVLRILAAELEPALAPLGVASPADLGPEHVRSAPLTRVYSG